jgi:3-oxoacyl-[acyl-carrier protein] reductase
VERVVSGLGEPTVLINNVGVIRDNLLFKMSDDDWDTVLNVHLRGSFLMTRAVHRYMVDQRYGGLSTSRPPVRSAAAGVNYSAARAGLQGFTKALAIEIGPSGITANAVAPRFIATDMTAARVGVSFEDFQKMTAERVRAPASSPNRAFLAERDVQIPDADRIGQVGEG